MSHCQSCHTPLEPNALYCHNCGKQTTGDGVICFACNNVNPQSSRFCFRCGTPINVQYTPNPNISPIYSLDFNDIATLPTQLYEAFKVYLGMALEQEDNSAKEALFLEILEHSSFRVQYLEEDTVLMTQQFEQLFQVQGSQSFVQIEQTIERHFAPLLERFFIEFCSHLLPNALPKRILNYQEQAVEAHLLRQMIHDYLVLEQETVTAYINAIEIPFKKLKNARNTFFSPQPGEIPYVFIDQTLLRSGKEGCILTANAIYWKAYFQKSAQVAFSKIEQLHFHSDRLEINGIYLNINPSINYKLYHLLQRLKMYP